LEFRVLGGHQADSTEGRPTSFLIDGTIALDAGGLTAALSTDEQLAIEHVVITHQHYDHIRDLGFLALAMLTARRHVEVHCTQVVYQLLRQTILNPAIWVDPFVMPEATRPTFVYRPVTPGRPFKIGELHFSPLDNRHHTVPVVGYEITAPSGKRLLYTGDTGPGIQDIWPSVKPDVLVTEVTLPNAEAQAPLFGHLTAELAEVELRAFREQKGYLPRLLICHVNQAQQEVVGAELKDLARRLQASVECTREGLRVVL
jgi:ribonuclease BN (tRNA processing enzyme)